MSSLGNLSHSGRRMTAEEFFALGETSERLQLIDGIVVSVLPPPPIHQAMLHAIQSQLNRLASVKAFSVFPATDLQLGPSLVYCPDLVVYRPGLGRIPARLVVPPPPALIIEILAAGTKAMDLITKRDDYERCGVLEYWAIDPADNLRIRVWRQQQQGQHQGQQKAREARFIESALPEPSAPDHIPCASIPEFTLDLQPLRHLIELA